MEDFLRRGGRREEGNCVLSNEELWRFKGIRG